MGSPPARIAATVFSIALLAAALLPVPGRSALAAARCTLDRATGTTIDPSPFLTGGYNLRWNAATDRLGRCAGHLVRQTGLVKLVRFSCP